MLLPASEMLARRHTRLRGLLGSLGLDGLIVTSAVNQRYLANHVGSAGVVVVTADAIHLAVDFRYREAVARLQSSPSACPGLRIWDVPGSYDEALLDCLRGIGAAAVGFEAAHVSVARHTWWHGAIRTRGLGIDLRPTDRVVERLRLIKDASEIATLRDAARRLGPVSSAVFDTMHAGMTERAVAALIESGMREQGFERPAFDTIVASGPNSALPHHRAGDRTLADGDLVVLDFGGVLDGYCCDLTRTVSIGRPSAEARRLRDAVFAAHQAAIAAVAPGVSAGSVDAAARNVLQNMGLGDAFGHGTGHGLGLEVHEEPRLGRPRADGPAATLESGMVFTIEPGAYLPGLGGVRIEDDVLVTETGGEVLTTAPREFLNL